MEGCIFEQYTITIEDEGNACSISFEPSCGKAFENERRKIYIVSAEKEVIYVGEANTSIETRLKRGCSAFNYYIKNKKARKGYRGYKWLSTDNHERILTLSVVIFLTAETRITIEAIEGEIVYLVRKNLDCWPTFQNEIHFSNVEGAFEKAESIYNSIPFITRK